MMKYLSVSGFGDVSEEHFESGLALAENYFSEHGLDFLECHDKHLKNQTSELGMHWQKAERKANLALYAFNLQDGSMLELEIREDSYNKLI